MLKIVQQTLQDIVINLPNYPICLRKVTLHLTTIAALLASVAQNINGVQRYKITW